MQVTASDGSPDGFIVGGIVHLSEDGSDQAAVLRLDNDGGINLAAGFGVATGEGEIHSVARSESGDFVFGGWAQVPDNDGWMFEVEKDSGTVLWSKNYGLQNSTMILEGIGSVVSMGSMGIVAAGWTASEEGYKAPLIFRTDTSGEVPGCSLITNRPVQTTPIDNLVTMFPDYDTGSGGSSVGSKVDEQAMGFKRQKACPLDCLFYVDDDSLAVAPDGSDWSSAFQSVQEAIDEASTEIADMGYCEVWAAEGTYHVYESSQYDTVALAAGVHLYGGFDGVSDLFSSRDWEENETILSGESADDPTNRVYHVVAGADDAWLDGFYVERGYAMHETEGVNQIGGGMLNAGVSTVVRNCVFRENLAAMGAGVFNYGGSPVFDGCTFSSNGEEDNFTTLYGGGMANYVLNGMIPPPRILDSEFSGNSAVAGSAVANVNADGTSTTPWAAPFFVNALIHGNSSTGQGALDGAVLNVGANAHPTFVQCTLAGNTGEEITGGMVNYQSDPMIRNSIFWGDLYPSQSEEISSDATSSPEVWYSDMQSVWTGIGDFNLSSNPDFPIGGYSLQAGSPCIDTAEDLSAYAWLLPYVNHDIADPPHPRPYGPGWDMGCYENQGE